MAARAFLPKEWIMEQWDKGFYITAIAGAAQGMGLRWRPLGLAPLRGCWALEQAGSAPAYFIARCIPLF